MTIHTFENDPAVNDILGQDIMPFMNGPIGQRVNRVIQFAYFSEAVVRKLLEYSFVMVPNLLNSWENYPLFNGASYTKDCLGVVRFMGVVRGGEIGQTIFILDHGYRPVNDSIFMVASNSAYGEVRISHGSGEVQATIGSNEWLALDGLTYSPAGY